MAITKKQWLIYGSIALAILLVLGLLVWLLARSPKDVPIVKSAPLGDEKQEIYLPYLHEKAKDKFRAFIRKVEKDTGWKVIITSGYRTFAKQAELKAKDSRNATPGHSYHNYGMAIDINLEKDGKKLRMASPKNEWLATGVPAIAESMNFVWGGGFPNYHDPVHFDLRKFYDMATLRSKATAQFGNDHKKIQGNLVKL